MIHPHWASKARAYEGVNYSSFYNGIDLKLYSSGDFVKYDFVVAHRVPMLPR